jgi:hypothetical protein
LGFVSFVFQCRMRRWSTYAVETLMIDSSDDSGPKYDCLS